MTLSDSFLAHPFTHRLTRRLGALALLPALAAPVACASGTAVQAAPAASSAVDAGERATSTRDAFRDLERERGGRVGVFAVDTGTGRVVAHRSGERFAFASTIKALAAAAVLDRLDRRGLDRILRWTQDDIVEYSPVTARHVDDGLSVRRVMRAAITVSDNTAGNLLMDLVGGPRALDRWLERLGDDVTSVDRREPELNDFVPGDVRDTTTPRRLARDLREVLLGDVLARGDRRVLEAMMARTTTGDDLVRAAVPPRWEVGDKTGSASYGTRNDLAIVRPPGRAPIVVAVLTRHGRPDAATDDALVADAARIVVAALR